MPTPPQPADPSPTRPQQAHTPSEFCVMVLQGDAEPIPRRKWPGHVSPLRVNVSAMLLTTRGRVTYRE